VTSVYSVVFSTEIDLPHIFPYVNTNASDKQKHDSNTQKVYGKTVPVYVKKAYGERRGIPPLILNLETKMRSMVNITPRPLYSRDRTAVLIEQEAMWVP
jgi:hypothetical protein